MPLRPRNGREPPSFLAISRSKWHFPRAFSRPSTISGSEAASTRQIPKTRERATRDSFVRQSGVAADGRYRKRHALVAQSSAAAGEFGHARGLRPTARQGRASRAFPPTAQIGRERRGAENASVTSRGARNIFSPLVDDLTVCDPLCSFCGDRTDNLTPACQKTRTPEEVYTWKIRPRLQNSTAFWLPAA